MASDGEKRIVPEGWAWSGGGRLVLASLDGLAGHGVEVEQPFIERLLASDAFREAVAEIVRQQIAAAADAPEGGQHG